MVTIKDVSKKCGYSVTTVSKAINDYSDISESTKQKILNLCDEMGYIPNVSARSLVSKKSYTIGIIFEEVTGVGLQHPLFSKILESFKNIVESKGYDILFLSKSIGDTRGSYLKHSMRKQVEGILILCGDFNDQEMIELYDSKIPTVVIDYNYPKIYNVTSNNQQGVEQAVKYLKNLGHTKIGHIYGGTYLEIGRKRKEYFENCMKTNNLDLREEYMASGEFFSKENGFNAMQEILELENLPTAIFCASDMLAIGAIQAINQTGKSVPEDFSIIGFDGIDLGQLIHPRLTTIRQNTHLMGKIAANQILQQIEGKNKTKSSETIQVDTYLITGETTKVIR
ncbi:MAG: LacI family transcriptional regulator [Candidatus Izimaplasma sp.]|nr:LacI family transcriptional regulator [Candidatus Izimaplasma bacterium]